jgi:hypothetical protein
MTSIAARDNAFKSPRLRGRHTYPQAVDGEAFSVQGVVISCAKNERPFAFSTSLQSVLNFTKSNRDFIPKSFEKDMTSDVGIAC